MITYPNVKINLGLSILRKRPDGYHDLETLFVPCNDKQDCLEIIPADSYSETAASLFSRFGAFKPSSAYPAVAQGISEDGRVMVTIGRAEGVHWDPLKDLTVRAYYALAEDFALPSVKIFLEKRSPVGAGLGGGSADAAFALRMISEMFGLGLDEVRLAEYAAKLGSDCPFFVYNRPMFGEGRGEVLSDYELPLNDLSIKLFIPEGISISTREAYAGITPRERRTDSLPALRSVLSLPVGQWRGNLVNDFEEPIFASHPELAALKASIYERGAVYAAMSGSGSALFGLFPSR